MTKIHYINAHCGSGKTEAAIRHVLKKVRSGERYVILQPTIPLIQQTEKRLRHQLEDSDIVAIYSEDGKESVTKRLHEFLTNPGTTKVLLITFQGWKLLKRRKLKKWNLIVDEAPTIFEVSSIRSKTVGDRLLNLLDFAPSDLHGDRLVTIRKRCAPKLTQLVDEARTDKALEVLSNTARAILAGMKTFVSGVVYEAFGTPKGTSLTFYHVNTPSIFSRCKSVTIMAGNFTDTTLYHIWKHLGVNFQSLESFGGVKLEAMHPEEVGKALDIHYLVDEWSASRKKFKGYQEIYKNEFRRATTEVFGDQGFIYTINSADDPRLLEGISTARYVSPMAHGLNEYRNLHCAAVYAHFNHSADRVGFLARQFGIKFDVGWGLLNRDYYYQFVCRTSLRETPSVLWLVEPKKVILMDKGVAEYLQTRFPGSRVHKFQSDLIDNLKVPVRGRKPAGEKPATNAERTSKSRNKHKEINFKNKINIIHGAFNNMKNDLSSGMCNEISLNNIKKLSIDQIHGERRWSLTMIGFVKSKKLSTQYRYDFADIISVLRDFSNRYIKSKNSNELFNLTEFGDAPNRQKENVRCSYGLLMDMDSELNCCPMAFSEFCSGLEMVLYSSFSSSVDRRRWRAVIPFSRSVTEKEYNLISKDMLQLSFDGGFPFDDKKRANDFMYLPCHGANEDAFFFKHVAGGIRKPLDVERWFGFDGVEDGEVTDRGGALGHINWSVLQQAANTLEHLNEEF